MSTPRTGADFAAKHVRKTAALAKIAAAIAKMKAIGKEHWEYESDLTKAPYNISMIDLSTYRGLFGEHWLRTEVQEREKPFIVWFADPKVASRYRSGEQDSE